jgi:hypothetical protein
MTVIIVYGVFSISFLATIFWLAVKIIPAYVKKTRMKATTTTSLVKLIHLSDKLKKHPRYFEINGLIDCENPIQSPISGIDCVYYELTIIQSWFTISYNRDVKNEEIVHRSTNTCEFRLADKTEGARFIIDKKVKHKLDCRYEKEFDSIKNIPGVSVNYSEKLLTVGHVNYRYIEHYLPVNHYMYFIGNIQYDGKKFILKPGGAASFVSDRKEEETIQNITEVKLIHLKWMLISVICFGIAFIGFYGKPEGFAEILRGMLASIIRWLGELGVEKPPPPPLF